MRRVTAICLAMTGAIALVGAGLTYPASADVAYTKNGRATALELLQAPIAMRGIGGGSPEPVYTNATGGDVLVSVAGGSIKAFTIDATSFDAQRIDFSTRTSPTATPTSIAGNDSRGGLLVSALLKNGEALLIASDANYAFTILSVKRVGRGP